MNKPDPNLFTHPLSETPFSLELEEAPEGKRDAWSLACWISYQAAIGDPKLLNDWEWFIHHSDPGLDYRKLMALMMANDEAAIRQSICLIAIKLQELLHSAMIEVHES